MLKQSGQSVRKRGIGGVYSLSHHLGSLYSVRWNLPCSVTEQGNYRKGEFQNEAIGSNKNEV
jgi:hypothetical protein